MGGWESVKTPDQTSKHIFKPLIISMVGIALTALAIVAYQFISTKYCMRRRAAAAAATDAMLQRVERSHQIMGNGVDDQVLKSIPIITYSKQQQDEEGVCYCVHQSECSVCLGDLEEGEMLRLLPNCRHVFHVGCIDQWWLSHSNCPICRSPVVEPICVNTLRITVDEEEGEGGLVDHHREEENNVNQEGRRDGTNNSLMVGSNLRHCVSLIWPKDEKNQQSLPIQLKRSLSMDCSYVCIKIQGNRHQNDPSSSSSSPSSSSSSSSLSPRL